MSSCDSTLIVGGGAMAINHHVPRLFRLMKCKRIVIFEVDDYRRKLLEHQFESMSEVEIADTLPCDQNFDLVVIATPPKYHFQYFVELAALADNFLIEKPITINALEAEELRELSDKLGKKVFVNLLRRSLKSYSLIGEFVRSGRYGKLQEVKIFEGGVFDWKAVSKGSFSRDLNGGGVLMDTGPHTLDLLFQVFDELSLLGCRMDGQAPAIEANCQLYLSGNGQFPIQVSLSRNRRLSNTARFDFELAELAVGVLGETIEVRERNGIQYQVTAKGAAPNLSWPKLVDDFYLQFLVTSNNSGVGPLESTRVARIIDRAYAVADYVNPEF